MRCLSIWRILKASDGKKKTTNHVYNAEEKHCSEYAFETRFTLD